MLLAGFLKMWSLDNFESRRRLLGRSILVLRGFSSRGKSNLVSLRAGHRNHLIECGTQLLKPPIEVARGRSSCLPLLCLIASRIVSTWIHSGGSAVLLKLLCRAQGNTWVRQLALWYTVLSSMFDQFLIELIIHRLTNRRRDLRGDRPLQLWHNRGMCTISVATVVFFLLVETVEETRGVIGDYLIEAIADLFTSKEVILSNLTSVISLYDSLLATMSRIHEPTLPRTHLLLI